MTNHHVFAAACIMQFLLGSLLAAGVVARSAGAPAWVAPVRMFFTYVVSIYILRFRFFTTARLELLGAAAIFSLGGNLAPAILLSQGSPGFAISFCVLGGVGGGLALAAVGRLTAAEWQGKNTKSVQRANFIVFPIFMYCLGGHVFSIFFEKIPAAQGLAFSGISTFSFFAIAAFFVLPRNFAVREVPVPAPLVFAAEGPALAVIAAAAHTAVFIGRAKQPAFSLVLNGLGRYLSGFFSETLGFRMTAAVTGAATAAALASENFQVLSVCLGGCVGLVGRCPQSQAASVVYGVSFAVAVFLSLPILEGMGAADSGLHALGGALMAASFAVHVGRKTK